MTRPTLLLISWLACASLPGDEPKTPDPKPPATELEGVWRESTPPGAKDTLKATFTFSGETVRIDLYGQMVRGSFTTEPRLPFPVIVLDIVTADGKRLNVWGIYRLEKGTLCLSIGSQGVDGRGIDRTGDPGGLGLAPLVLTLEKLKP